MEPPHQEPEMEELLQKLAPDWQGQVEGATYAEIKQLEQIAGRPLPQFYQWFLASMGRQMGPFAPKGYDCSIAKVIWVNKTKTDPDSPFFLVGYDEVGPAKSMDGFNMGSHWCYDLDSPLRDDARLVGTETDELNDPALANEYSETFREFFADHVFRTLRIDASHGACRGRISHNTHKAEMMPLLEPVLKQCGLKPPVALPKGPYSSLCESPGLALSIRFELNDLSTGYFALGYEDAEAKQTLLNKIVQESGLRVVED